MVWRQGGGGRWNSRMALNIAPFMMGGCLLLKTGKWDVDYRSECMGGKLMKVG